MFKKFHNILGKLFLSSASFFWVSCDSGSSAGEPGPLIDIEAASKFNQPDTTGLRGQCISVKEYCDVIDDYHTPLSNGYDAKAPARDKVNERLNSKKLSDSKRNCYKRLAQSLSPIIAMPEYGVPYCDNFWGIEKYQDVVLPPNIDDAYLNNQIKSKQEDYQRYLKDHNLTACSPATKGVFIDDQYINAALENEQRSRDSFRSDLEYINKQAAECDDID